MGLVKELYMAELERKMAELVDSGMSEDEAYELAGEQAYAELGDRMVDMADNLRKQAKENAR